MHTTLPRTLLPVACAALLAACGGGGGSASDPGPKASANSDVSASNYQSFTAPLAYAVIDVGAGPSVAGFFGGAAAQSAGAVQRALGIVPGGRATIQSVRRQAVVQDGVSCDFAGSLAASINDANNNNQLDVGESLTVTATGCQFASTDQPMNGSFSMTVQKLQVDSQGYLSSLQVSGNFSNLSMGSDSMNGGFSMSLAFGTDGSENLQMSLSNLAAVHGSQTVTYNASLNASYASTGAGSYSINGTLQRGSEVYLLEQSQNFAIPAGADYPTSGSLRLEDAASDALVLEAKTGGLVDFKFYPAGSTTPTQQSLNLQWSAFGG